MLPVCKIKITAFDIELYLAMEHGHRKLLEVINMIHQQFSSNDNKKLLLFVNALCLLLNTTLSTHLFNLALGHV